MTLGHAAKMLWLRCLPQGLPTLNRNVATGLGAGCLPRRRVGLALQKHAGPWRLRGVAAAITGLAASTTSKSFASEARARSALPSERIDEVGYITDLEGDLDTFNRYLGSGRAVLFRDEKEELQLRSPTAAFVFGGDLFDRGPGDLQLARELVALKKRHPDRVFLIMGNRDINKMRFTAELQAGEVALGPDSAFQPWWDPKATKLADFLAKKGWTDTPVARLKWMLTCTLGSPHAFGHRRAELARLAGKDVAEISEAEVLESYSQSVLDKNGEVVAYLRNAQVGVIIGDTLFVHGAVEKQALGFVPSATLRYRRNSPEEVQVGCRQGLALREWIDGLNAFAFEQVEAWQRDPFWQPSPTGRVRGGEALMAYQCRPAMALHTVVVTCYVDGHAMPARKAIDEDKFEGYQKCSDPMSKEVLEYLLDGGVRRVVVGHKPSGQAPAVLHTAGRDGLGYEVVSADTNYASSETSCLRGGSWAEVRISLKAGSSQTRLHGVLPDGRGQYDFHLPALGTSTSEWEDGDPLIGHETSDGWWVRVRLGALKDSQSLYLLSKGSGRKAKYVTKGAGQFQVFQEPPSLSPRSSVT